MFHYVKSLESDRAVGFGLPEVKPEAPKGIYAQYLKRFLDMCFILMTAPVVLPIVGVFALLTKRDGGPAFYAQPRIGRDGRKFNCWKIRSMVVDADKVLNQYLAENPEANAEWVVSQKLRKDPRITFSKVRCHLLAHARSCLSKSPFIRAMPITHCVRV